MIEIVYQDQNDELTQEEGYFHIPKNIRQIGESPQKRKIYIEDYVYTYLNRTVEESMGVGKMAILLGECHWINGVEYMFVKSCFQVEGVEVNNQNIPFDDEIWASIYSNIKEHFSEQEIIGWFLSVPDFEMEINNLIYKTHLEHFPENDKMLFALDSIEKEEQIYIFDNGQMEKQKGYYIYYEKNEPMQAYLIQKNQGMQETSKEIVEDKAVQDFRKKINSKNGDGGQKKSGPFLYVASTCLAVIVLAAGAGFINNYEKMQSMEDLIAKIQGNEVTETNGQSKNKNKDTIQPEKNDQEIEAELKKEPVENDNDKTKDETKDETANSESSSVENSEIDQKDNTKDPIEEDATKNEDKESENKESVETAANINKKYMVKKGDTISGISETCYGTIWKVAEICEMNGITSEEVIYPGQIILLP